MTHPTDDELEAMAVRLDLNSPSHVDADIWMHHAAAMLRACKGRDATVFEAGLNTALKCIASLGYGKNQDVDEGHEDAFRAVETCLKDWKANKPAAIEPAPDHSEWQPIETCPASHVLFYGSTRHDAGIAFTGWKGVNGRTYADSGDSVKPTHWMPLPAPPALKKGPDHD